MSKFIIIYIGTVGLFCDKIQDTHYFLCVIKTDFITPI